jgi:hypothetical protein
MKIEGSVTTPRPRRFKLSSWRTAEGEAVELLISSLPYGWADHLTKAFGGVPLPPTRRVGEDSRGQPVFRPVAEDPIYRERIAKWEALVGTSMIYQALRDDPKIRWDAPAELLASDPVKFYELIADELKASGIEHVEVQALIRMIEDRAVDGADLGAPMREPASSSAI